jgi:hypothetical protein
MSLARTKFAGTTLWQHNLSATPSLTQWGTRLTASGTPHAKGSWATFATATYDVYGFWLGVNGVATSATRTDAMIDIGFGTSGSPENIIVPEYLCGWRSTPNLGPLMQWFPIFIPKGAIIQGRIQALIASDTADVAIWLNGGTSAMPGPLFSGCDAYGTATASSIGTSHTPGNTGAESTDASIGSTTTKNYGAVAIGLGGTLAQTTQTNIAYHWELTISGTTVAEWFGETHTTEAIAGPFPPTPFYCNIPIGTQLQVQAEASGTAQAQDVAFYCFF